MIWVFLLLLVVRLASVFIVQTYFAPDEYWQSLEVAHKLVFGYGYLTWEWVEGIRSYIYPAIIAAVYKISSLGNFDTVQFLVLAPRILQALLSAYSDYRFYVWTGKRKWAILFVISSWFWFYIGSRTLANTLETSLTTIALSHFPWHRDGSAYLWLAALCCFLRPTAILIWIPLGIYNLQHSKNSAVETILKRVLPISLLVFAACVAIDSYFYGRIIVTPYEFFKYNVLRNIGSFYGSYPWYWYFTVGLPTVLGINFLVFLYGLIETIRNSDVYPIRKQLLITIFVSLLVLSALDHKEFRFLSPLLPLCLYICADAVSRLSYKSSRTFLWIIAFFIVLGNSIPAWYIGTVHQRGPTDLMPKLQEIAVTYRSENSRLASILYLMPCHSTPFYSHVHENVTMRFLTCEPNLKNKPNYKDEADQFYESPVHWLNSNIPSYPRTAMPSHVVLFEPLSKEIGEFLGNYKQLHSIPHSEYFSPRTGNNILVFERKRMKQENAFNRKEGSTP